ncbi:Homeobox-leucine zipper protein HAT22 [Linum grandiflorum]
MADDNLLLSLTLSTHTSHDHHFPADIENPSLALTLLSDHRHSGEGRVVVKREREREIVVSSTDEDEEAETTRVSSSKVISDEDDDDGGGGSVAGAGGRKKLRLTREQSALLEESFKHHSTLNTKQKQELARKLNLGRRQVEVWFQNRRARSKLKQTEVDCQLLKKCYQTLTDENNKLKKELHQLKTAPFYSMTVSLCPSCGTKGGDGGGGAVGSAASSVTNIPSSSTAC